VQRYLFYTLMLVLWMQQRVFSKHNFPPLSHQSLNFLKNKKMFFFFKNRARANELAIINIVDNLVVDNFEVD